MEKGLSRDGAAYRELKIGASTVTYKRGARPRCWARRAIRPIRFLVMPVCDYSLQGKILGNTPLPWPEAQQALLGI